MATDQGKTANVAGLALMAELTGQHDPARPARPRSARPIRRSRSARWPASTAASDFRPTRLPPSHDWAQRAGRGLRRGRAVAARAVFPQGRRDDWLRERRPRGDDGAPARRHLRCLDARQDRHAGAGRRRLPRPRLRQHLLDAAVGKARYGLMLREDGFVLDDGTVSPAGASSISSPRPPRRMPARCCSTWNSATRCSGRSSTCRSSPSPSNGRSSRSPARARATCCAKIVDRGRHLQRGVALHGAAESRHAAACRRGCSASPSRASWPTRSPCRRATAMRSCRALMQAGAEFGIAPYGTEALGVLRIEKGHVERAEIDGRRPRAISASASWCRRRRITSAACMSARPALVAPDRPDPRGAEAGRPATIAVGGRASHRPRRGRRPPTTTTGTSPRSPSRRRSGTRSGSASSSAGRERIGERIRAVDLLRDRDVECERRRPVFIDPKGERLRG